MTRPGPPPGWCANLAIALAEMSVQVGELADRILRDWPDDRGRERAERTAALHRELGRDALAAAQLGKALARDAAEDVDAGGEAAPPALPALSLGPAWRPGTRLAGTEADRVDPERGVRIAQLPDPGPQPG